MSRNRKNREFCLCGRGLIHQSRPVCAKNCPIVFIFLNGHNPSTNTAGSCNLCNIWATVPHQPAVRKSDQTRWAFGSMREPVRPTGSDTQTLIHSRSDAKHSNSDTRTSCHSSHVGQRTRKWAGDKNVIRVFFLKEWMDRRGECARVRMSRVHRGTCRIHSYHPPTSFSAVRDVTAIWFLSISFCIFKLY